MLAVVSVFVLANEASAHGTKQGVAQAEATQTSTVGFGHSIADCHDGISCSVLAILISRAHQAVPFIAASKTDLVNADPGSGTELAGDPPIPILIH